MSDEALSRNTVAFIGLANEYCQAIENCAGEERATFVEQMLKLLPRLYISITDSPVAYEFSDTVGDHLAEEQYTHTRNTLAALMGEEDTYLETFEEDMKYSDTPIAASVSENLADIYQDLYNFMVTVRESEGALSQQAIADCRYNFELYWSRALCNVLRALNNIRYSRL